MTQETIFAELKKMQMQMIPHITKAIQEQQKGVQHLVLTDHHLGLAIYYFTQKLKSDEIHESSDIQETEGRDQYKAINDTARSNNEHQGNS